jgi:hypothetical protein
MNRVSGWGRAAGRSGGSSTCDPERARGHQAVQRALRSGRAAAPGLPSRTGHPAQYEGTIQPRLARGRRAACHELLAPEHDAGTHPLRLSRQQSAHTPPSTQRALLDSGPSPSVRLAGDKRASRGQAAAHTRIATQVRAVLHWTQQAGTSDDDGATPGRCHTALHSLRLDLGGGSRWGTKRRVRTPAPCLPACAAA